MKKYTITSEEYELMCAEIQSLQNENSRLKGYIKGLKEQLRTLDVVNQSEKYFCCKEQIGQRCSRQCLGCFQFENKD